MLQPLAETNSEMLAEKWTNPEQRVPGLREVKSNCPELLFRLVISGLWGKLKRFT